MFVGVVLEVAPKEKSILLRGEDDRDDDDSMMLLAVVVAVVEWNCCVRSECFYDVCDDWFSFPSNFLMGEKPDRASFSFFTSLKRHDNEKWH